MKEFHAILLICTLASCINASDFLSDNLDLDNSVTAPSEFLSFNPGEQHALHYQILGYMELLAKQSDRMQWSYYGSTHGGRKLGQLIISSPDNLRKLEDIRTRHLQLADPKSASKLDLKDMPLVVNLNYSVHGNEASGANASLVVAYYLAAAISPEIEELLDNLVILLDPVLNPDGMDRFANWTNNHAGMVPNPDPNDREHREGWPNGRTNYYWFDLNRDWMLLTQPESQGRIERYHKWLPNFVLDFHETGTNSTYFFQPGVPERSHPLIPESVYQLTERVSKYFADALDEKKSLYFTKERFDDFYMGKGSTISDLKGAIGILFEQASARGVVQDSENGQVTFEYAISNQVDISLAVLKGALEMRLDFLEHMREFYDESLKSAKQQNFAGYKFSSGDDPSRAICFAEVLIQHGIEVNQIDAEKAWFIPINQPQYRYLEALVEQRKEFEESIFYDITAWSLPLAYNLEWEKLKKVPITNVAKDSKPPLEKSRLGYVFDWKSLDAPRILFDLLQEDVQVKVAGKPFSVDDQEFGYGSIFVPLRQQEALENIIYSILEEANRLGLLTVAPVDSYLTETGIDFGSNSFATIRTPKILLAAGYGIDTNTTGSVWHLLDVYHDYPVTMVDPDQLGRIDLNKYTALVLPGAGKGTYPESLVEKLSNWINQGGILITLGRTTKWAIDKELSTGKLVEHKDGKSTDRKSFVGASDDKALQYIKGAIFNTTIDITHPLAYGYLEENLPVFLNSTNFLAPSDNPYQTPLAYTDDPLIAGYASIENLELLKNSAAVVVEPMGKGSIVQFAHHPTFRAYWRGTEKLLLNAILFGQLMGD